MQIGIPATPFPCAGAQKIRKGNAIGGASRIDPHCRPAMILRGRLVSCFGQSLDISV